jgi:hypothetical protein
MASECHAGRVQENAGKVQMSVVSKRIMGAGKVQTDSELSLPLAERVLAILPQP